MARNYVTKIFLDHCTCNYVLSQDYTCFKELANLCLLLTVTVLIEFDHMLE